MIKKLGTLVCLLGIPVLLLGCASKEQKKVTVESDSAVESAGTPVVETSDTDVVEMQEIAAVPVQPVEEMLDAEGVQKITATNLYDFFNGSGIEPASGVVKADAELYSINWDGKATASGSIKKDSAVTVLCRMAGSRTESGEEYLLVSLGEGNLWEGWIKLSDVRLADNSALKKVITSYQFSVSPAGDAATFITGFNADIYVVRKSGEIVTRIGFDEIQKTDPDATDGSVAGWPYGGKSVLYNLFIDAVTTSRLLVDVSTGEYKIVGAFQASYYIMDIDSGDALYTDFPRFFDPESLESLIKSGKEFHLYYTNMFTGEKVELQKFSGRQMGLKKGSEGQLMYEAEAGNYVEYSK